MSANTSSTATAAGDGNSSSSSSNTTPSLSRYASYAYPGASVRQPNYIVEHAAPAMLCLLRKAEPRPYTPLAPDVIVRATQPNDYTLRPPPHLSHQAVLDLYRVCDGHYGLSCEQLPHATERWTRASAAPQHHHHHPHNSSSSNNDSSSSSSMRSGSGRHAHHDVSRPSADVQSDVAAIVSVGSVADDAAAGGGVETSSISRGGTAMPEGSHNNNNDNSSSSSFTQDVDRYRLSQFKRNAQHVDSAQYARVCNFYHTKEGCRRGANCDFVHLDRSGHVVPTRRNRSNNNNSGGGGGVSS